MSSPSAVTKRHRVVGSKSVNAKYLVTVQYSRKVSDHELTGCRKRKAYPMTLVRIDVIEGRRSPAQLEILAEAVHATVVAVFGAAVTERYQIITEHRPGWIITFESGLGQGRTDDVVIVEVVQSGQTRTQKRALYRELTERLYNRLALREDDLIMTIVENTHADWSFTDRQGSTPR
jgi:phenylpyruvate tautomerase PptA (4-oxalocrotonate tautomerase family)